jgi:hypothetical protein
MAAWNRPSGLLVAIAIAVLLLAFTAGCGDTEPTSSQASTLSLSQRRAEAGTNLASCETDASATTSAMIGPDGGMLSAGPATVFIPPQAVRTPTRLTIQPLAGHTLRVRITAKGHDRFGFARPIAVMIGYAHCSRQEFLRGNIAVWHVDDLTDALLEPMPTVHDRQHSMVGFLTAHLSTYAVAH